MASQLRGNDLRALGFPEGRAIGLALAQLQRKHLKKRSQTDQLALLGQLLTDPSAIHQMETAMKLPVTVAGALMPDAHHGYGLPIGGVLATDNAVIPYAVGVDIGCRMALSVFALPPKFLGQRVQELQK